MRTNPDRDAVELASKLQVKFCTEHKALTSPGGFCSVCGDFVRDPFVSALTVASVLPEGLPSGTVIYSLFGKKPIDLVENLWPAPRALLFQPQSLAAAG